MTESFETIIQAIPTKPYYRDEQADIVIYNADCREILPLIPDKSIDLVLTSPPYDNLRAYGGQGFKFEGLPPMIYKVLDNDACCVWIVGDETINGSESGNSFRQALCFMDNGFNLHDTMIFAKPMMPQNQRRYEPEFEYMFILSKGTPEIFNPLMENKIWFDRRKRKATHRNKEGSFNIGKSNPARKDKIRGNIWFYSVGGGHSTDFMEAHQHPAIFPEALANDHIVSWSNPNNLILDPFLGSGTTAYCAKKLGRKCIGIEVELKYCRIAAERCAQAVLPLEVEQVKQGQSNSESLMFNGMTPPAKSDKVRGKVSTGEIPKEADR